MLLLGPFAVAAAVVMAAALAKLWDPRSAAGVTAALGLPSGPLAVRALAVVELGVGGAALVLGGWMPAAAIAVLYLSFTAVAALLVRRPGASSCGCFGALSSRVTKIHVATDAVAALVALAATLRPVPGLVVDHGRLPAGGAAHAVLVVVGAVLVVALLGPYAETLARAGSPVAGARSPVVGARSPVAGARGPAVRPFSSTGHL